MIDFHNLRVYWVTSIRHKIPILKNRYNYTASSERSCLHKLSCKEAVKWAEHLRDTRNEYAIVSAYTKSGTFVIVRSFLNVATPSK